MGAEINTTTQDIGHTLDRIVNTLKHPTSQEMRLGGRIELIEKNRFRSSNQNDFLKGVNEIAELYQKEDPSLLSRILLKSGITSRIRNFNAMGDSSLVEASTRVLALIETSESLRIQNIIAKGTNSEIDALISPICDVLSDRELPKRIQAIKLVVELARHAEKCDSMSRLCERLNQFDIGNKVEEADPFSSKFNAYSVKHDIMSQYTRAKDEYTVLTTQDPIKREQLGIAFELAHDIYGSVCDGQLAKKVLSQENMVRIPHGIHQDLQSWSGFIDAIREIDTDIIPKIKIAISVDKEINRIADIIDKNGLWPVIAKRFNLPSQILLRYDEDFGAIYASTAGMIRSSANQPNFALGMRLVVDELMSERKK